MQDAGPRWAVVLERSALARTLHITFLEVAAPGKALSGGLPADVEQEDSHRRCAHPGLRSLPPDRPGPGSCPEKQKGKARPGDCGEPDKTDDGGRSVPASLQTCRNPILRSVLFEFALELAATHRA